MDFHVPELGEGVYEAELVAWKVKPDDRVKRGQVLMEVLTDKATMEVPAAFAGAIQELLAEPGAQIKVGQKVLTYAASEPAAQAREATASEPAARAREAVASADSTKSKTLAGASGSQEAPSRRAAETAAKSGNGAATAAVKAAPSVRLMARKLGIDLGSVQGSGPHGRILIEDLSQSVREASPTTTAPPGRAVPMDLGKPGARIKLLGIRRKIADHMVLAKRTIPHYSYVDECDVSELVRLRDGLREPYQSKGVRITYLPFMIKAVVAALQEVPLVNASLDESAGEIVLHDRYHIGIAVAAPAGLIVPVVHDADKKNLLEIARDVERLSSDARTGKVKLEDLRGGTFTVTSIGSIGGLFATPVINHPEVGILGVGKMVKRPVFDDHGQVRAADLVYLSFSFDHRVLDGAVGAVFGNAVIKRLQSPVGLLID